VLDVRYGPASLLGVLLASPVVAGPIDDPSLRVEVDTGYACFADERRFHGLYAGLESAYVLDGFWGLRGGLAHGAHRSKGEAFDVTQTSLGVRYQLDVFTYVPWLDVSGVAFAVDGDDAPELAGGLAFGFGFDYLLDSHWSLGFVGRYHQVFGLERFPAYVTLGARLGYRWNLGDPFDS